MPLEELERDELAEAAWTAWELKVSSMYCWKKALQHVELIERVPVGHSHADEVAVFWGKSLQELAQIWLFSRSGPEQPGFRCYLQDFHFCFVGNSCFYVG